MAEPVEGGLGHQLSKVVAVDELHRLRQRLLDQAPLFADPASYRAGVDDVIETVERLLLRPPLRSGADEGATFRMGVLG